MDPLITAIVSLIVVLVLTITLLTYWFTRRGRWPVLRSLAGFEEILADIGRSVESGTRIHMALGRGEIAGPGAEAEFAGLSALRKVAQGASVGDRPPVVTSGDGATSLLSQDVMYSAYRELRTEERFDPDLGRLAGLGAMGYAAGAVAVADEENVSATLILGAMGPEVALIADSGSRRGTVVAGVTDPIGQAAAYVTADYPLVGEELFAVGAYLRVHPSHGASLLAQDLLRWIVILIILLLAFTFLVMGMFQ
jgi:hypothetical protein